MLLFIKALLLFLRQIFLDETKNNTIINCDGHDSGSSFESYCILPAQF